MARSIRFSGISKKDASELFRIEPNWWSIDEIFKTSKFNWITSNETGSYFDETTEISTNEARELHTKYKPKLVEIIAYNEDCIEAGKLATDKYASLRIAEYIEYVALLQNNLTSLESAFGDDNVKFSHFKIHIFEWDSGY